MPKNLQRNILKLIRDTSENPLRHPVPTPVESYQMLTDAVFQKDLSDEMIKLQAMSRLDSIEAIKEQFATLCEIRATHNLGSLIYFDASPYSLCNTLYITIAKLLYPEASDHDLFIDLFNVSLPTNHTDHVLTETSLPVELSNYFLRQIVIEDSEQLTNYLINFPPHTSTRLIGNATINFNIFEYLHELWPILHEIPRQTLLASMIKEKNTLGLANLLEALVNINANQAIEELLSTLTSEEAFAVLQENQCEAMLVAIETNPEAVYTMLNKLSFPQRATLIQQKKVNSTDFCLLYWAAIKNTACLEVMLSMLSKDNITAVINEEDPDTRLNELLLLTATHNEGSFILLLNLIPENQRRQTIQKRNIIDDSTMMFYTIPKPRALQMVLSYYPENERSTALLELDINRLNTITQIVEHAARDGAPDCMIAALTSLHDYERLTIIIKAVTCDSQNILHLMANNSIGLEKILALLPEHQRRPALLAKNAKNINVLQLATINPDSVAVIEDLCPKEDRNPLQSSIIKLISDTRKLPGRDPFQTVIINYQMLLDAIYQQELTEEMKKLREMAALSSVEKIKERFLELCLTRGEQNHDNLRHFRAKPNSICNTLYFNMAKLLYPDASFQELFKIVLPEITNCWHIELKKNESTATHSQPKKRRKIDVPPLIKLSKIAMDDINNPLASMPKEIDTFKHLAIADNCVFPLDEVAHFNFEHHKELYQLAANKRNTLSLMQAIEQHNHNFNVLYNTISYLHEQRVQLRYMLLRLVFGVEGFGYSNYSTEDKIKAKKYFIRLYEKLPPEIQTNLNNCKSADGQPFSQVITLIQADKDILEICKLTLEIMANPLNKEVLDTEPFLDKEEETSLIKLYQSTNGEPIVKLNGELDTRFLHSKLDQNFYPRIVIIDVTQLTEFLCNIPTEDYAHFLCTVATNFDIPSNLETIHENLDDPDYEFLLDALIQTKSKWGEANLLAAFEANNENDAIERLCSNRTAPTSRSVSTNPNSLFSSKPDSEEDEEDDNDERPGLKRTPD